LLELRQPRVGAHDEPGNVARAALDAECLCQRAYRRRRHNHDDVFVRDNLQDIFQPLEMLSNILYKMRFSSECG
jgi:hypothetical protein